MGKENGFDLLRELQEAAELNETDVIVLTNLPEDHEKTARALGATAFFVKAHSSINQVIEHVSGLLVAPRVQV